MKNHTVFLLFLVLLPLSGQNKNQVVPKAVSTVTDIDGNTYGAVQIGKQVWMSANLKVTKYPDGTSIPYVTGDSIWAALSDDNTSDAYCYCYNDTTTTYGALYSYAAAIGDNWARGNKDNQGVCPDGWHLPSDAEWKVLELFLGMNQTAVDTTEYRGTDEGTKLKATSGWSSSGNGTDDYGFSALPGGYRYYSYGRFYDANNYGNWWSSTENSSHNVYFRLLHYDNAGVSRNVSIKSNGFSVRCLRD